MFGYVKPYTPELKVRDNELYKAFYCGLCRALGAGICHSARFTLSYDIVMLAIVRAAASGEPVTIKAKRCFVHPLKKRPTAYCDSALPYAARASALMTYYKVADDANDEKGCKRFFKKLAFPFAKRLRKKASLPELDAEISSYLGKLSELESNNAGPEECADTFGKTLGSVFAHGFGDKSNERILFDMGYHIGRWIYLLDAADDLDDDRAHGRFNPFLKYDDFKRETLENALNLELLAAQNALSLISGQSPHLIDILENVITLGMPDAADKILKKSTDKETKQNGQRSL